LFSDQPANKPAGNDKLTGDNGDYTWEGGVGPNGTVVALTAICAHQLSYPDKGIPDQLLRHREKRRRGVSGVIVCCEHDRVYDPAKGGR